MSDMLNPAPGIFKKETKELIWFTADWHYSHTNIIKYCNRPFSNVDEMNATLINNFKNLVNRGKDTLYFLGDLSFNAEDFKLLMEFVFPENTVFIRGNHDRVPKEIERLYKIYDQKTINIDGQIIILNHFCLRVWDRSHYNSWHLYAHSHGTLPSIGKSHDVGVDNNNFMPISFEQLKKIMNKKPDNPNLIKRR
jgi:calcineurin-like phosphoesterase family protein